MGVSTKPTYRETERERHEVSNGLGRKYLSEAFESVTLTFCPEQLTVRLTGSNLLDGVWLATCKYK